MSKWNGARHIAVLSLMLLTAGCLGDDESDNNPSYQVTPPFTHSGSDPNNPIHGWCFYQGEWDAQCWQMQVADVLGMVHFPHNDATCFAQGPDGTIVGWESAVCGRAPLPLELLKAAGDENSDWLSYLRDCPNGRDTNGVCTIAGTGSDPTECALLQSVVENAVAKLQQDYNTILGSSPESVLNGATHTKNDFLLYKWNTSCSNRDALVAAAGEQVDQVVQARLAQLSVMSAGGGDGTAAPSNAYIQAGPNNNDVGATDEGGAVTLR